MHRRVTLLFLISLATTTSRATDDVAGDDQDAEIRKSYEERVQPLLKKYCLRCHNGEDAEAGIRFDQLNGELDERRFALWKGIRKQVGDEVMPPENELQPTEEERRFLSAWIGDSIAVASARDREKNGSVRRLTVAQYRNTLRDLLGLEEELTAVLPPDSVSKDGFLNNGQLLLLSPLLVEAYFEIAEKALDLCIVDEKSKPTIQSFRVDLGAAINRTPCPDKLILGAFSQLLKNDEFVVTELTPGKPFVYTPFFMRTKYRFIEGYEGNATVRGWREYDSIYHAVFAGMRGNPGYPKGLAHQSVPEGLLLRPAIPSAELFEVESTYGPRANFKISLRELPDHGRFRVTVKAAKYNDGLLLDPGTEAHADHTDGSITVETGAEAPTVAVKESGVYQADVYLKSSLSETVPPDGSKLQEGLIGAWKLDGHVRGEPGDSAPEKKELEGQLVGDAKFVDSPFGQAISLDGTSGVAVIPPDGAVNVGEGDFTVTAWIHPRELRQAGIVCRGSYGYTHGWLVDMPDGGGALRIETATADSQANGTVTSRAGVIRAGEWQHVAVVVRRGDKETRLYVNGFEVGAGTVKSANLDNPNAELNIGRVAEAELFSGEIDEVRLYRRALEVAEIQALVEPGRDFARPPPEEPKKLSLQIGDRHFSGILRQAAFLAVRLPAGPLDLEAHYDGKFAIQRLVFTPLSDAHDIAKRFETFERRSPRVGVHVGLRRDCGSTLNPVGAPRRVSSTELSEFVFEGAINNFPSPDVEKDNVNYLAGIREIGVRSEYTDGRDMPRLLVRSVEFEGPLYDTWPPATHRNIFVESDNKDDPASYAREVIRSFATRAFRRPITDAEEALVFAVWKDSFEDEGGSFDQSIKDALVVVLTSPQFLFLIEKSETPEPEDLDAYELASKLSYFLWNAAPDERLLKLAAADQLHKSLDAEIDRMIRDARFRQFAGEFVSQWLRLDKLDVVEVDRNRFPKLTRDTKTELRKEPVQFLLYLIQRNLPLRNLIQSDFIVANEVVAGYYDLGGRTESGFEFVAIAHEDEHLGGVLSQAGILAGLSNGRESNPVKRGAWLARKIIAEPPEDPPPNVPALPEDDGADLTLREKLERHRDQKGCANCHAGIDPWGLPLEQFDAGGRFKSNKVDARSTLPDNTEVADANGLKAYLADDSVDRVAFSFLKHLAIYAIGRSLNYNEIDLLKTKAVELKADGYRMQDMIRFVIKSEVFLEK